MFEAKKEARFDQNSAIITVRTGYAGIGRKSIKGGENGANEMPELRKR
jgi:hypothetical protein